MKNQIIVIKLGTSTLTGGTSRLCLPHMVDLVRQVAALQSDGKQVIVASSGAIAAGKEEMDYPDLQKYVPAKQMLSAIGQPRLMSIYTQLFTLYNKKVAQVLLTRGDLSDRRRYLNARNTLESLISHDIIPIINENDAIATEEIRFGDNDNLSALIANLIEADLLVLITDQQGLFTKDPRFNKDAKLVHLVDTPEIPEDLWSAAGGSSTGLGTGGMVTKLRAADLARRSGTTVVIADGSEPDVLLRVARGEQLGTRFTPTISTLESRKRYMLAGMKSSDGELKIDRGAASAIRQGGSLLPVGILQVVGQFERGDTVRVSGINGKDIAIGLVNYTARDIEQIRGKRSSEIENLLGYSFGDAVIHHNSMMVL